MVKNTSIDICGSETYLGLIYAFKIMDNLVLAHFGPTLAHCALLQRRYKAN